jgi:hypothetical protein
LKKKYPVLTLKLCKGRKAYRKIRVIVLLYRH